jgi:hypothetical protein
MQRRGSDSSATGSFQTAQGSFHSAQSTSDVETPGLAATPNGSMAVAAAQAAWANAVNATPSTWQSRHDEHEGRWYSLAFTERGLELLTYPVTAGQKWAKVHDKALREAVIKGAPAVTQAIGWALGNSRVIAAGAGLGAAEGAEQVLTAAYRQYKIWADPTTPRDKPDWLQAFNGAVSMVAHTVYGAGVGHAVSRGTTAFAGSMVAATTIIKPFLPETGGHEPEPLLPVHNEPSVALRTFYAQPAAQAAMSRAAALPVAPTGNRSERDVRTSDSEPTTVGGASESVYRAPKVRNRKRGSSPAP